MTTPNDKPCRICGRLKFEHAPVTLLCGRGSGEFYEPLETPAAPVAAERPTPETDAEGIANSPQMLRLQRKGLTALALDRRDSAGDHTVYQDIMQAVSTIETLERQRDKLAERLAQPEAKGGGDRAQHQELKRDGERLEPFNDLAARFDRRADELWERLGLAGKPWVDMYRDMAADVRSSIDAARDVKGAE